MDRGLHALTARLRTSGFQACAKEGMEISIAFSYASGNSLESEHGRVDHSFVHLGFNFVDEFAASSPFPRDRRVVERA